MSEKRLLFIVSDLRFFLSHRLPIAVAAQNAGYKVAVACPPASNLQSLTDLGILYLPLYMQRGFGGFVGTWRSFRSIQKCIRDFDPDVTHLITSKPVILGGIAARISGRATVAAITGLGAVFVGTSIRMRALRQLILFGYKVALKRKRSHFVFQNDHDANLFSKYRISHQMPTTKIPGAGVHLDRIHPEPLAKTGLPVVLLPARMLRIKGVIEFVEAAKRINSSKNVARFRLVGDPDPFNPTSLSADELASFVREGLVEWQPHTDDINTALGRCHVVLLPTHGGEGLPKTLIDAAAAGRVAIASDVPGCRDAIVVDETGFLVQPKSVDDIVATLSPLLQNKFALEDMGKRARLHAEKTFDIRKVCETHLEIYNEMIQGS